jgi:hypothetical protein
MSGGVMSKLLAVTAGALLIVAVGSDAAADTYAITEDGRRVLLRDDGAWELDPSSTQTAVTFRKTSWGQTRDDVRRSEEGEPVYDKGDVLGYKSTVARLDCLIGYVFVGDQLVRGRYQITETHSNKNDHIRDYIALKVLLERKYGTPDNDDDETEWRNDLYKDDNEDWGLAVSIGHVVFTSRWEAGPTDIVLLLNGDNYKTSLVVEYQSRELRSLEEMEEARELQDEL